MQNLLRTVGVACIIAGTVLYFTGSSNDNTKDNVAKSELHAEISDLKENLERTKEELANLQIATSAAEETVNHEEESSSAPIIKTILRIESGTTSSSLSYELERSGIIEDTTEFDLYLSTNDLSGKIQIGEYDLDSSMSMSQIAKIITKSK